MKKAQTYRWMKAFSSLGMLLTLFSCVEEVNIDIENELSSLVVHAILTDEYKHQEISLSRTYAFNL